MNAWMVTWEGTRLHTLNLDKVVAILNFRKTEKTVREFIELLYLRCTSSASDMAHVANRPKEIVFKAFEAKNVGELLYPGRFYCGNSEFMLFARQVTSLDISIDNDKHRELLTWREPSTYRFKGGQGYDLELAAEGETVTWEREYWTALSRDLSS